MVIKRPNNIFLLICCLTLILIVLIYYVVGSLRTSLNLRTSTVLPSFEKQVNLGEEFTLKLNEIAQVKNLDITLKITSFKNSPCPKNVFCIWSGVEVRYQILVNGKAYEYSSSIGPNPYSVDYESSYDVFVKNSDYQTYAKFVIKKPDERCLSLGSDKDDLCWSGLAKRFKDQNYCQKITRTDYREKCIKELEKTN